MCTVTIIQDDGIDQTTTATTLNFVGLGVRVSGSGAVSTVSITSAYLGAKRDFGAIGDGIVDDTSTLQNAINASSVQRVPLVIPSGQYKITSSIAIVSNATIFGYGAKFDNHTAVAGVGGVALRIVSNSEESVSNVKIYGLEVDGRKSTQPTT